MRYFFVFALFTSLTCFAAREDWSVGAGAGLAIPVFSNQFNDRANSSVMASGWARNNALLPVGLELGYDFLDFSDVPTQAHYLGAGAVFHFLRESSFDPTFLLGAGWGRADSQSRVAFKARLGVEKALWHALSAGLFLNYHLLPGANSDPVIHALSPMFALTYNFGGSGNMAYAAPPAPVHEIEKDSDGDGVADNRDQCPNTPAGTIVNSFGCPLNEKLSIRFDVEFPAGSSTLPSRYEAEVARVAKLLADHPEVKGRVQGYTDSSGSPTHNKNLSQQRAQTVLQQLLKEGVKADRLQAEGFGPAHPIASNKTKEGRAKNRRVVLLID